MDGRTAEVTLRELRDVMAQPQQQTRLGVGSTSTKECSEVSREQAQELSDVGEREREGRKSKDQAGCAGTDCFMDLVTTVVRGNIAKAINAPSSPSLLTDPGTSDSDPPIDVHSGIATPAGERNDRLSRSCLHPPRRRLFTVKHVTTDAACRLACSSRARATCAQWISIK